MFMVFDFDLGMDDIFSHIFGGGGGGLFSEYS